MAYVDIHAARWARGVKLLAPGEGNRLRRNPQVAHIRHVHHVRIPRVNLYGIPIPIANGRLYLLQRIPADAILSSSRTANAGGVHRQADDAVFFLKLLHEKVRVNPYIAAFRVMASYRPAFLRYFFEYSDHVSCSLIF